MRHSSPSASRPGPSGSGPSTPSDWRSCAMPGSASNRWSIGRRSCGRSRRGPMSRRWSSSTGAISRLKLELRVDPSSVVADPEAGPVARAYVDYSAAVAATGGLDFDDLVLRAIARLEADPELLERWRLRCAPPPRRRGPGRRSRAARPGAAPRGAREPDLAGRRRRPVHLRMASRRRPARAGPRRATAGAEADRPGGQLPVPRAGRRAGRPARRAQRGTLREGHPFRPGCRRPSHPGPGRRRRPDPPRPGGRDLAGRRLHARRAGPHEPRAHPGRRGRARCRDPVPCRAARAAVGGPGLDDALAAIRADAVDGEPSSCPSVAAGRRPRQKRRARC